MVRFAALNYQTFSCNSSDSFAWKVWHDLRAAYEDNGHMAFKAALDIGMTLQRIALTEWVRLHLPYWPAKSLATLQSEAVPPPAGEEARLDIAGDEADEGVRL